MKAVLGALKEVPWLVWAAIAPAIIIGAIYLRTGGGVRVPYVAAGVGAVVTGDDHPEGTFYTLDTVPHESFAETAARVEEHIREYPDVMVIGLDGDALVDTDESEREAMATLMTLARHAENATTIPVILSLTPSEEARPALAERSGRIHDWWRRELCRAGEYRVCVDLAPHVGDASAVKEAVISGVAHGVLELGRWRATTQGSR